MEFGQLIVNIFNWALALVGLAVFVNFIWAGFLWFTAAGRPGPIASAKEKMFNALIGAIILLASYIILNTINPDLVKQTFTLPQIETGGGGSGGGGGGMVQCDNPPNTKSPDPMPVMLQVRSEFPNLNLTDESPGGDRDKFTSIVAWRLSQQDSNWGRKKSSAGAPISTDTLGYKREDIGPGRFEAVDLLAGGTGALQRGCYGVVESTQVWVAPTSP